LATLNLGIVAHVDAGKTSLTERLLFDAGVISSIGGVDTGDTQTDTDDLERSRGITIRSAVVAFNLGELHINLIDTPGHSDFIAEVERSMAVLDAAILVISAVEGVQAQTRVLMRTLRRLRIPTMIFVNKIDRMGARSEELIADIRFALTERVLAMTCVRDLGTRAAGVELLPTTRPEIVDLLTDQDDRLLSDYVDGGRIDIGQSIARQTAAAALHPLYFGSAITGAGIAQLAAGMQRYLPTGSAADQGPVRGQIFKIERGSAAEKISYLRLRSGVLKARDQVELITPTGRTTVRVTAVQPFTNGTATEPGTAVAGDIAKVWGLRQASIGDQLGGTAERVDARMTSPGLESVVTPERAEQRIALHTALELLAEEDPLINTHLAGDEIAVSLYGEVQGEVLRARLLRDFGISADFAPARTVYVEKPVGVGEAVERIGPDTPFLATVGPKPCEARCTRGSSAGRSPIALSA
jgi:ribosomal protection tetracycline resistance protein